MYFNDYILNFFSYIEKIFSENPIGQTIGIIALFINIFAFITSNDNKFLILMAISSFFWGIHFYCINLIMAACINFFDIFKNILILKYKRNMYIFYFLIISYFIILLLTFDYEKIISIIPSFTSILSVFFLRYLNGIKLKIGFLFIFIFWFIYNFFGNSFSGMISSIIFFISGIIGILNILKNRKKTIRLLH